VPIVLTSGILKLLEPSGSVQACRGIALPFYMLLTACYYMLLCRMIRSLSTNSTCPWYKKCRCLFQVLQKLMVKPFQIFACKSRVLVCTNGYVYHHSRRFSSCALLSKLPAIYSKLVCCCTGEIFWVVQHNSLIVTTRLIVQAAVPTQFCLSDIKTAKSGGHLLIRGNSI